MFWQKRPESFFEKLAKGPQPNIPRSRYPGGSEVAEKDKDAVNRALDAAIIANESWEPQRNQEELPFPKTCAGLKRLKIRDLTQYLYLNKIEPPSLNRDELIPLVLSIQQQRGMDKVEPRARKRCTKGKSGASMWERTGTSAW